MTIEQLDIFVQCFKNFNPNHIFYASKILEELLVRDTLNIGEINLIFHNKKTDIIRKTVEELVSAQLICQTKKHSKHHAEKRFKITNSGESLLKTI